MTPSEKVLEFATKAHAGQFRKYGQNVPYITHPIAVAKNALVIAENYGYLGFWNEIVSSIAYLHDVLEDTSVTPLDLLDFLDTIHQFTHSDKLIIYRSVTHLTKSKENFDLMSYLAVIKDNRFAQIVKLADLQHNVSDLKDQKKLDYYRLIEYYLKY
jgi:(p)ppGpp synthase/HD superfamily hydrolase